MLTINPNEEALLAWPGLDTLVRRVVLRRPEEPLGPPGRVRRVRSRAAGRRGRLLATDLTWYRITSRDLPARRSQRPQADAQTTKLPLATTVQLRRWASSPDAAKTT